MIKCLKCNGEVERNNGTGKYKCTECGIKVVKRALCDQCGEELERLAACGAEQFFCNKCKELKSKKGLNYFYREGKEDE